MEDVPTDKSVVDHLSCLVLVAQAFGALFSESLCFEPRLTAAKKKAPRAAEVDKSRSDQFRAEWR